MIELEQRVHCLPHVPSQRALVVLIRTLHQSNRHTQFVGREFNITIFCVHEYTFGFLFSLVLQFYILVGFLSFAVLHFS